jgi:hypothetical protein
VIRVVRRARAPEGAPRPGHSIWRAGVAAVALALVSLAGSVASAAPAGSIAGSLAPATTAPGETTTTQGSPPTTAPTSTSAVPTTTSPPTSTSAVPTTTSPPTSTAAGAGNDDFTGATVITELPFSAAQDTSLATTDPTDPGNCQSDGSVWFAFTPPSDMPIEANTFGSDYDTTLSAWTGTRADLLLTTCNDDYQSKQSRIAFNARGGTTYYFLIARCAVCGDAAGNLRFSVVEPVAPANDDFADATALTAAPFTDMVDLSGATVEASEPTGSCAPMTNTAWYALTPPVDQFGQLVHVDIEGFFVGVAMYAKVGAGPMSPIGCVRDDFGPISILAKPTVTYYFQVGFFTCCSDPGPVTFRLDGIPNPVASFDFSPTDPSALDTIGFTDRSSDPAGTGIRFYWWDFGDGTTSEDCCPTHRYASDGDYTVRLNVTTPDNRSASASLPVRVRTHDVAITQVSVPNAARAGQAATIKVELTNTRYPETVRVDLFRSDAGGVEQVGTLTQPVPLPRPGAKATRFAFTYTPTQADRTLGMVSFKAAATILGHRDAIPADNELASPPVRIT